MAASMELSAAQAMAVLVRKELSMGGRIKLASYDRKLAPKLPSTKRPRAAPFCKRCGHNKDHHKETHRHRGRICDDSDTLALRAHVKCQQPGQPCHRSAKALQNQKNKKRRTPARPFSSLRRPGPPRTMAAPNSHVPSPTNGGLVPTPQRASSSPGSDSASPQPVRGKVFQLSSAQRMSASMRSMMHLEMIASGRCNPQNTGKQTAKAKLSRAPPFCKRCGHNKNHHSDTHKGTGRKCDDATALQLRAVVLCRLPGQPCYRSAAELHNQKMRKKRSNPGPSSLILRVPDPSQAMAALNIPVRIHRLGNSPAALAVPVPELAPVNLTQRPDTSPVGAVPMQPFPLASGTFSLASGIPPLVCQPTTSTSGLHTVSSTARNSTTASEATTLPQSQNFQRLTSNAVPALRLSSASVSR